MTRLVLSLYVLLQSGSLAVAVEFADVALSVREPAGIRRRSDVVSTQLDIGDATLSPSGFRLLKNGELVPAQFRRVDISGKTSQVALDFVDHFEPFEERRYVVRYDANSPSEELQPGLRLTETADGYEINSSGVVDWTIRRDLQGLIGFAAQQLQYVVPKSVGLLFLDADGQLHRVSDRTAASAKVQRQGPVACSLEFHYDDWPPGLDSSIQLEFVRTKSWVHVIWQLKGTPKSVQSIGAELQLLLADAETLVDFGGGDFVYTTVRADEQAVLQAGPAVQGHTPWSVFKGSKDTLQPLIMASREHPTPVVHGWAHVMDQQRCTALAMADFGRGSAGRIEVHGDGRLRWTRELPAHKLEFWLHFVSMPVHIGARTSPRSMQEPLPCSWESRK